MKLLRPSSRVTSTRRLRSAEWHSAVSPNGIRQTVRSAERAFTMVEIALALAVIGFALVAIIGILPAGLNVQKENREETIINQDAAIWMNALRGGSKAMDYLTNYVDGIVVESVEWTPAGNLVSSSSIQATPNSSSPVGFELIDGGTIVGLLSTPKYLPLNGGNFVSNHVTAYVRAISGNASEKAPNDNPTVREGAFAYRLTPEIAPFIGHDTRWTNYVDFLAEARGRQGVYARNLAQNMYELRLGFRWPLRPPLDNNFVPAVATNVGSGRQVFRTVAGGTIFDASQHPTQPAPGLYFFQPGVFKKEDRP